MRSVANTGVNQLTILAIPESATELSGYREESPYPLLKLTTASYDIGAVDPVECSQLTFSSGTDNSGSQVVQPPVHPDLLACLCVLSYAPFLKRSTQVSFPEAVSPAFAKAFDKLHAKLFSSLSDQPLSESPSSPSSPPPTLPPTIENINPSGAPYVGTGAKALAFGGGLDSSATLALFQDVYIIHEQISSRQDRTPEFMRYLSTKYTKWAGKTFNVVSNNKVLTSPAGWTGWACCVSTSVWLASSLGLSYILLGSSLASYFTGQNGSYFKLHTKTDKWLTFLTEIGLTTFSPIYGLSELALAKMLYQVYPKWLDQLVYCIRNCDGGNCHRCQKCFRREVILNYVTARSGCASKSYSEYLNKSSLLGVSVNACLGGGRLSPPLLSKYYAPALLCIPASLRNYCQHRIYKYFTVMSEDDIIQVESTF